MNKEARRRRMHGCTEAAAFLVCRTDFRLGRTERINDVPTTKANTSFAIRWTCLSLVAIPSRQMVMVEGNRVRGLSGLAVSCEQNFTIPVR